MLANRTVAILARAAAVAPAPVSGARCFSQGFGGDTRGLARDMPTPTPRVTQEDPNMSWKAIVDRAGETLLMTEMATGAWIGLKALVSQNYTINYPLEKGPISPRFRGEHALRRYPTGEER